MFKKVLILSYSFQQANQIYNYLKSKKINSVLYKRFDDENKFRTDYSINCLIVANRYNGLDFSSKVCNTCIITNLPMILSSQDSFSLEVLKETHEIQEKTANRIIQGIGRCNRELDDKSIYFIMDNTMISEMTHRNLLRYFPKQIIAELRVGFMASEAGRIEDAILIGRAFLDDKFDKFDTELEKHLKKAGRFEPIKGDPNFRLEIRAWDYLINDNFENAVKEFEILASKYGDSDEEIRKKAWYYYLAAFCYYKLYKTTNDEKYQKLYDEKLKICSNCNAHPVFNKASTIRIEKKEELKEKEISLKSRNLLDNWVKNPQSIFELSWNSSVLQDNKSSIISGLKTLANGEFETAAKVIPVDIEKILGELVKLYGDPLRLPDKPTYVSYIDNLWSRRVITKTHHEQGKKGDFSITNLRNMILHGKESFDTLSVAVKYILKFITFIDEVIYDTAIYNVLSTELMDITYIPYFEEIRAFKSLDTDKRVMRIITSWAEEQENHLIIKEDESTIGDIKHFRLILKIWYQEDKTEIHINV